MTWWLSQPRRRRIKRHWPGEQVRVRLSKSCDDRIKTLRENVSVKPDLKCRSSYLITTCKLLISESRRADEKTLDIVDCWRNAALSRRTMPAWQLLKCPKVDGSPTQSMYLMDLHNIMEICLSNFVLPWSSRGGARSRQRRESREIKKND